jgi:hypothetical protein
MLQPTSNVTSHLTVEIRFLRTRHRRLRELPETRLVQNRDCRPRHDYPVSPQWAPNHALPGVAGVYNRYAYNKETAAAWKLWGEHVSSLLRDQTRPACDAPLVPSMPTAQKRKAASPARIV